MPLILGANSVTGGYAVDNSCRFNAPSSDYLNRTPAIVGNRKTFTFSSWIKISNLTPFKNIFQAGSTTDDAIRLRSSGTATAPYVLDVYFNDGSNGQVGTNMLFRDVSAWYHIVCAIDTTQATSTDRIKVYINGTLQTLQSINGYPTLNYDTNFNNTIAQKIGTNYENQYFEGYMSEVYNIDGQALTPTDFGEFDEDSGVWKPIAYTGTYGTNGFYLEFKDSSALGDDTSGNSNDFTVNNLTSIDQTTDTPTNNFATLNALDNYYAQATFSNGNLTMVTPVTEYGYVRSSIGVSSGKWYAECKITTASATDHSNGVAFAAATSITQSVGINDKSYGYFGNGQVKFNNSSVGGTYASLSAGNIIGIALDLDNNKLYFSKDGVFQNSGDPTSGATGTGAVSITAPSSTTDGFYYFASSDNANLPGGTYQFDWDFGNPPFAITTGNEDANGYGNFEYAVPPGYYALCTANLAEFG
jgi:hypothetical protein